MTEQRPNHSPRHRPRASKRIKYWTLFCMIAFILACYGVLVYQLYVWQVRDAESYRAEAVTQQLKDTTLPAVRGSIYSANGKLLAKSSTVWNIVADPSSVLKSGATEDQIRAAAEHIAELLDDGTTADTVYKALTASNKDTGEPYQYRVVKKGVALAQAKLALLHRKETLFCANNLSGCIKDSQRGCIIAGVDAQRIAAHSCSGSASRPCSRATVPSRPLTN